MTIFNGLLEAKKGALKNGAIPALAIAIDAPNKKVAENIIIGKLWEAYPDHGDNYFKPKIWEDAPGNRAPASASSTRRLPPSTFLTVKSGPLTHRLCLTLTTIQTVAPQLTI